MKAIVITGIGGPEVLEVREVPTPEPQGDQVRVRVRACGLNRADLLQCRGMYPAPPGAPPDIPGLEHAGEVDALGPGVVGPLKQGDRVFGIVAGGGQAEYVLAHERMLAKLPPNIDFTQAAAVPEAFITAHDALLNQGRLAPGERVLVHAAGSGVGTAAVQVAHAMGCFVIGTSRTPGKFERIEALGADRVIDPGLANFDDVVQTMTDGRGVNVVIDLLGGSALANNLAAVAPKGRLVLVGLLAGSTAPLDLTVMLRKRITITGTTLRARPLEEKITATSAFAACVVPWIARGLVRPVVDSVFPFEEVRAAQARLESNQVFGKVVLQVSSSR
jgi:putative PIG3 family NAD(P)H quinone oxidoreductase